MADCNILGTSSFLKLDLYLKRGFEKVIARVTLKKKNVL